MRSMVRVCDVVTINAPLHPETEHLFDDALIAKMKRGAYIVNTARGKICDRDAIARALESGQLAGMPETSGSRSRLQGIIPGGPCPTTG
jgi:formate dehydrogenase